MSNRDVTYIVRANFGYNVVCHGPFLLEDALLFADMLSHRYGEDSVSCSFFEEVSVDELHVV